MQHGAEQQRLRSVTSAAWISSFIRGCLNIFQGFSVTVFYCLWERDSSFPTARRIHLVEKEKMNFHEWEAGQKYGELQQHQSRCLLC